jgi:hypothetical protein
MPMNRKNYPPNWDALSREVRERAGQRCECRGECGEHCGYLCGAPNRERIRRKEGAPWVWSLSSEVYGSEGWAYQAPIRVVLTVAHLCHDSRCADPACLLALCQRCHLRLDAPQHAANARATRARRSGQGSLL